LRPVGEPVTLAYARDNVPKLFQALKNLHDKGICHGDARWKNMILVDGELVWIDLATPEIAAGSGATDGNRV